MGVSLKVLQQSVGQPMADPQRLSVLAVDELVAKLRDDPLIRGLLQAMPIPAAIINDGRQIIAGNEPLQQAVGQTPLSRLLGFRPGEVIGCDHAFHGLGGCGTSEQCQHCGALNAILESQSTGGAIRKECEITTQQAGVRQIQKFTVNVLPVDPEQGLRLLTLEPIATQLASPDLDRMFMHDLLNSLSSLEVMAEQLHADDLMSHRDQIKRNVADLREQVVAHREMKALGLAQSSRANASTNVKAFLEQLCTAASALPVAEGRHLVTSVSETDGSIDVNQVMLRRVLLNLVKNAMEAIEPGQEVVIDYARIDENKSRFVVQNPGLMSMEIKNRLFREKFSTKAGPSRGIGTQSVRYLTEEILGGQVHVDLNETTGTSVVIEIPTRPNTSAQLPKAVSAKSSISLDDVRILIADDTVPTLRLTQLILTRAGAITHTADNGRSAVRLYETLPASPDLILLDLEMPGLDGFEVARAIRSKDYDGRLIAMTAHRKEDVEEKVNAAGFDFLYQKPIGDREAFLVTLVRWLSQQAKAA